MSISIADRLAITEVMSRYCHAMDAGDGLRAAVLFSPKGSLVIGDSSLGCEEIAAIDEQNSRHLLNGVVVEGEGSNVRVTAAFTTIQHGGEVLAAGHLSGELTKQSDEQWKIDLLSYTGANPFPLPSLDAEALSTDDRVSIMAMIDRNGHAVDRRDARMRADCYVEDAVYQYVGQDNTTISREALFQSLDNASDPHDSLHWTANHVIEGTNTDAKGSMYFAVYYEGRVAATGIYNDTYKKVDGRWLIVSRIVTVDKKFESGVGHVTNS